MTDVASLIADMVRAGVDPELIGRMAAALAERELEREWLPLRRPVLVRDGFTCRYCGFSPSEGDAGMCVDHVVPLSRGGSNEPDNLVACCMPCNSSKNNKTLSEWEGRGNVS